MRLPLEMRPNGKDSACDATSFTDRASRRPNVRSALLGCRSIAMATATSVANSGKQSWPSPFLSPRSRTA
eukprot:4096890-Prymnesium_polylepis.1